MNRMKKILFLTLLILLPFSVNARSGCCSHHGGVCSYRCPDSVNLGYYCCDGTSLSSICAPYYPKCPPIPVKEVKPDSKSEPTPIPNPQSESKSVIKPTLSEPEITPSIQRESKPESQLSYTAQIQDKIDKSYNWVYWLLGIVIVGGIISIFVRKK